MPHVITLTGPSGAGKSSAVAYLLKYANPKFKLTLVQKYTTRLPRNDDSGEALLCVRKIPKQCDLVYEQYGVRYGLELEKLFDHLAAGLSPLVILNDVRAVQDVRAALGELVKSVFIFREGPSLKRYAQLAKDRNVESDEYLVRRFNKAQAIYRIYIENIQLFDHVILNDGGLPRLKAQALQIARGLGQGKKWPLH